VLLFRLLFFKSVVEPKLPAIYQLADGLDVRGLLKIIRDNPSYYEEYFVDHPNNLTLNRFCEEIQPQFSDTGSNKLTNEECVFKLFSDYIESCFYNGKKIYFKATEKVNPLVPSHFQKSRFFTRLNSNFETRFLRIGLA